MPNDTGVPPLGRIVARLSAACGSSKLDRSTARFALEEFTEVGTLQATRAHGTVCFTGGLSDDGVIPDFSPLGYIPFGVRLTAYGGQATDLPADVFNRQIDAIAAGRLKVSIAKVYHGLEQVRNAQTDLEVRATPGKHVVVLD